MENKQKPSIEEVLRKHGLGFWYESNNFSHLKIKVTAAIEEIIEQLKQQLRDWEERDEDVKRLCREIDAAMFSEEGAAKQPALCDILKSVQQLRQENIQLHDKLQEWISKDASQFNELEQLRQENERLKKLFHDLHGESRILRSELNQLEQGNKDNMQRIKELEEEYRSLKENNSHNENSIIS